MTSTQEPTAPTGDIRSANRQAPASPMADLDMRGPAVVHNAGFRSARRQLLLLAAACSVAGVPCLVLAMTVCSASADLEARSRRAGALAEDARVIQHLRTLPQQAAEAGLPQSDLLARVSAAMRTAQLDEASLASTLPQPPRKRPGSDRMEIVHRLMLENVRLEPLVRFTHALTAASPALHISAFQLRAGPDRQNWQADMSVSYWVLALEQER